VPRIEVSPAFRRSFKRFQKRGSGSVEQVALVIGQLEQEPFAAFLGTHKLKGELRGYWSCSAGYDLRIVFEWFQDDDLILLVDIGTHDEVY
jgi:mRNA interferase YafQ